MALPLLTSLRLVIPRFQRARVQTDAALFKIHAIFPRGSAFTGIFEQRCLHLIELRSMQNFSMTAHTELQTEQLGEYSLSQIQLWHLALNISNLILLIRPTL